MKTGNDSKCILLRSFERPMVKILFIAYHFPPIGGGGVQRSLKFVRYLPEEGYLPAVITVSGPQDSRWTPEDSMLLNEISSDVPIYRIPTHVPPDNNRISHRIKRWLGVPSPFSKWWISSAINLGEKVLSKENIKLIYASMSPYESANVAAHLSNKFGIPWVADLRDPWALDRMQIYTSFIHRKAELLKMHRLLSTASVIVMNTPEATASLIKNFPDFRNKKIVTITNGFDYNDFEETVLPRKDDRFRIVHSGYLHTDLGLNLIRKRRFYKMLGGTLKKVDIITRSHIFLLKAIERWCQHYPEIHEQIELLFVGIASQKDRLIAEKSRVSGLIRFTGYQSHHETIKIITTADLLFLPMYNLPPGERSTIVPGKTYEYMASGRPILAAVPDGDARDFLAECGTAFLCRPDDSDEMVRILKKVYNSWKKGGSLVRVNKTFLNRFERKNLTKALAKVFDGLLSKVNNDH